MVNVSSQLSWKAFMVNLNFNVISIETCVMYLNMLAIAHLKMIKLLFSTFEIC